MRWSILLLLTAAFAGCADAPNNQSTDSTGDEDSVPEAFDYANATWPSGSDARAYIESYVMTHPYRVGGEPFQSFMDTARDDLVALLEGFGQNVTRDAYSGGENIFAIQEGTENPDQWVVLSAHYDTVGAGVGSTVYGAWDDGAGVATLLELAETYADWEFPFTIVYAFFDGEEKGLVGSREFVQKYGPAANDTLDILANLNTDPPGLNYPCGDPSGDFPVKIIHEMGKVGDVSSINETSWDRFQWLYAGIESGLDAASVPREHVDYTPGIPIATVNGGGVTGSSDHVNFGAAGIANVFVGGTPTTSVGPASALTYGLHTPIDTLQQMDARCVTGSLAGGLQTIVDTFTGTLVFMAEHEAPARPIVE